MEENWDFYMASGLLGKGMEALILCSAVNPIIT